MKNVTISLEEDLLARARSLAAQEGKSFNQAVRDLLEKWASRDSRAAIQEAFRYADQRGLTPKGPALTRDQLYDRAASREEWQQDGNLDRSRYPE